ncbi:MAG: caspase domain-containing protein [Bacteroidia bacterium]
MPQDTHKSLRFNIPKASSTLKRGINHLFVVGINHYDGVAKLSNAVRDAQTFRDVLVSRYGFDPAYVMEMYDKAATRTSIMQRLRELAGKVKPEDSVLIYFSGHGHYDTTLEEGYWVPVEATYDVIDDYISYSFLQKVVKAAAARHVLMIVDSCYSGAVLVRERDARKERLERDPSRWLIASGRNEVVPDGVAGKHSPFAEELIHLLNSYSDSGLSTMGLINRLTENVSYNSFQTPIGQPLFNVGHKGGQFIFYPKTEAQTIRTKPPQKPKPAKPQAVKSSTQKPNPAPKPIQKAAPAIVQNNSPKEKSPLQRFGPFLAIPVLALLVWVAMPKKAKEPPKKANVTNAVPDESNEKPTPSRTTPSTQVLTPKEESAAEKVELTPSRREIISKKFNVADYTANFTLSVKPVATNFNEVAKQIKYSRLALLKNKSREVSFWVYIDEKGNYIADKPVIGATNESVVNSIKQHISKLKFTPGKKNNKAVKCVAVVKFDIPRR